MKMFGSTFEIKGYVSSKNYFLRQTGLNFTVENFVEALQIVVD